MGGRRPNMWVCYSITPGLRQWGVWLLLAAYNPIGLVLRKNENPAKLAPDGVKSSPGRWNARKSTLLNPIFNAPGLGRAKNEGFQTPQNLIILVIFQGFSG